MKNKSPSDPIDPIRRKLLRTSMVLGGVFAVGQIPYTAPRLKSFFGVREAWAQLTGPFTIACSAEATTDQGPGTACQNAVIQNATAQVSPVPPAGTVLRCTPTTDDPANASLSTTSSTTVATDAAGMASFAVLDLTGNVPSPPLLAGSVLTMTVTFDDQATFGNATCVTQFTIVACP